MRYRNQSNVFSGPFLAVALMTLAGCSTDREEPSKPLPTPHWSAEEQLSKQQQAEPQQASESETPLPLEPVAEPQENEPPLDAEPEGPTNPLRDGETSSRERPEPADQDEPTDQAAERPKTEKNSGVPFDPIAINGPIFVDWPKPAAALVVTGMEDGYLEPCGCAGLDRMKGGMGRRATLFQELREKGWPTVGLEVGGLVHGYGQQAILKYRTLVEGKQKMGYSAIAFGAEDLRLPAGELLAVAAGVDGQASPFIAANVGLLSRPGEILPRSRVLEAGGVKIGVTAVLGKEFQKEIFNDEIELADPVPVLEEVIPELAAKADYLVLLAHATLEESIALGRKFPKLNVVVTSAVPPEEPPREPETIPGTQTLLIQVGHKGMDAIVLGLYGEAAPPYRYQRVPLDSRFAVSPDMKTLMRSYQEQLKALGFDGLGLRPVPHPLAETNGKLIGSKKCATCHEASYEIWRKTAHARAYETLEKLDPPRNFDPECVSCHVVGWHPTKYFPYAGGFESLEKTPHLTDVGCEDCHGPGEKHAAAEIGSDAELQEKLRSAMVVTKEESKKQQCYSCHDLDNSPDFDFETYWPFVEHHEEQ